MIICTLGKYSTQLLLGTNEGITGLRGRVFKNSGRIIMPINHPAAALYAYSRLEILKNDFKKIEKVISVIKTGISDPSIKFEVLSSIENENDQIEIEKDLKTSKADDGQNMDIEESKRTRENITDEDFHTEQMGLF